MQCPGNYWACPTCNCLGSDWACPIKFVVQDRACHSIAQSGPHYTRSLRGYWQIGLWLGKPTLAVHPGPIGAHAGPKQAKLGGTRSGPAWAHTIDVQQWLGSPDRVPTGFFLGFARRFVSHANQNPIKTRAMPKQRKLGLPKQSLIGARVGIADWEGIPNFS